MEPSSKPLRRAGALLIMIALASFASLAWLQSAAARGFGVARVGRVQAIRVVPRIPPQIQPVQRTINPHPVVPTRNAFLQNRLHRHSVRGAGFGFPYGYGYGYVSPDAADAGQPDYAAPGVIEAAGLPFEQAACVRPLIIAIKPTRHDESLPRVIYGRPPPC